VLRVLLLAVLALLTPSATAGFPPPYRQPLEDPTRLQGIDTVTRVPPLVVAAQHDYDANVADSKR
jgi:hypothetical protein